MTRRIGILLSLLVLGFGIASAPRHLASRTSDLSDFTHFESSQVHPIAITPDGSRLLVVNTPDNRVTVFDLTGGTPNRIAQIPVGLEPVSVALKDNNEAWVVNNLSDDISIVDLTAMHVRATLHVGDEPNDIVFAGPSNEAFVSVSQEDVIKVYNPRVARAGRDHSGRRPDAAGARDERREDARVHGDLQLGEPHHDRSRGVGRRLGHRGSGFPARHR
jgi:YVTN family beta-propeller protein